MENMFRLMGSEDFSDRRRCIWVNGPVIVGAGPSGLATAACLHDQGVPFVVLERAECIASLWQKRTYDRLKLHLPKKACQLPKMPFPENYPEYPTKRQFIDYLESYATRFDITPQFNECVQSARYDETSGLWRIKTTTSSPSSAVVGSEMEYICRWLVVATGENAERVVPEIDGLTTEFDGEVIHSCEYKSGEKYRGKSVLVVGCGNSGMEVSLDLANHNANPSMVVRSSVSYTLIASNSKFSIFLSEVNKDSNFKFYFTICLNKVSSFKLIWLLGILTLIRFMCYRGRY